MIMFRFFTLCVALNIFGIFLFAKNVPNIKHSFNIKINSLAKDIAFNKNKHWVAIATEAGEVKIYDYKKHKFIKTIKLKNITDFMGDTSKPEVFCIDVFDDSYLFVSQSSAGVYTNVWLYKNNKLTNLINKDDKKDIIKAKFVSDNIILLAYLSSDISLFDIKTKKELQKIQASQSKFSDFDISEYKKIALTSESGVVSVINIDINNPKDKLKVVANLDNLHTDNVYKIAFKQGIIATASQDRQAILYDTNTNKKVLNIKSNFFVYSTALSQNAKRVAFSLGENNDISVFDTKTMQKIVILKDVGSKINAILFLDENTILISNNQNEILGYKLNQ